MVVVVYILYLLFLEVWPHIQSNILVAVRDFDAFLYRDPLWRQCCCCFQKKPYFCNIEIKCCLVCRQIEININILESRQERKRIYSCYLYYGLQRQLQIIVDRKKKNKLTDTAQFSFTMITNLCLLPFLYSLLFLVNCTSHAIIKKKKFSMYINTFIYI